MEYKYFNMRYNFDPTEENIKATAETVVFAGSYEDVAENADLVIPEGVLEIAENAFRDFEHLKSVKLPKSLAKISASAFSGCRGLTRVEFEEDLNIVQMYKAYPAKEA